MERYAAYKDSGVEWIGEIPEGWKIQKISSLYDARNEKVSDKDYPPLSVTMQGILPQLDTAAKTQDGDNRKLVRKGDFAINSRSDRRGSCGVSDYDGSVSLITNVLAPRNLGAMDSHYYSYLFHTENFADEFYKNGTGIVDDLWSTNWSRMKKIQIPLPELGAQKAIAAYLDKKTAEIDGIVEETERSIELLREYRKSVISEAVTHGLNPDVAMKDSGIEWIGKIPEDWKATKIKWIASLSSGSTPNRDNLTYWDGDIPWIKTGEIQNGLITEASEFVTSEALADCSLRVYPIGTLLIAMYGQGKTRGMTAILGIEATTNQACAAFDFHEVVNTSFIRYALEAGYDAIRLMALGSGQPNLNADLIGDFVIPLPPKEEQDQLVLWLDDKSKMFDALIADKEKQVELLKEYRKSLISEAVTGKFKVPGVE